MKRINEESLYDGVGCESGGDGAVVGGVIGVLGNRRVFGAVADA